MDIIKKYPNKNGIGLGYLRIQISLLNLLKSIKINLELVWYITESKSNYGYYRKVSR